VNWAKKKRARGNPRSEEYRRPRPASRGLDQFVARGARPESGSGRGAAATAARGTACAGAQQPGAGGGAECIAGQARTDFAPMLCV
jgi:hypothetical protein